MKFPEKGVSHTSKNTVICNHKGDVGKTATTVNLGLGLAREGKPFLLADLDAQGSLTASLGFQHPDQFEKTITTVLCYVMADEPLTPERVLSITKRALTPFLPTSNCPAWKSRW